MSQLGPATKANTQEALAWARQAPVGKATIDLALLQAMPDSAIKIGRRIFSGAEQDAYIDNQDATGLTNAILEFYAGWRAPNLYTEVLNEIGKGRNATYVKLCVLVVPRLQAAGLKVLVPSWGTGDWEWEQWLAWRAADWCKADGISLHGYWGLPKGTPFDKLFTEWNALRYRTYWSPGAGDPQLLVVTELGRDKKINDGDNPPVGAGGYIADGLDAQEFAAELKGIEAEYLKDGVIGTPFTNGPGSGGVWDNYNTDPVVQYMLPSTPAVLRKVVTVPPPVVVVPAGPQFYPKALWKPLERNFAVGGSQPKIIVLHGTSGLGDPWNWWNTPSTEASADFWIPRNGPQVIQYVKLGDTSWSNGPLLKPDLSVPFLAWLVKYKETHPEATGNIWTLSIEFEKAAGNKQGLTAWQINEGRALIKWASEMLAIPIDRTHILAHYQFDSVNKKGCPGPLPWDDLIGDYAGLAESNYWGPAWSAVNWARAKGRVTAAQQKYVHDLIKTDKKIAGVE